ncbi:uncharacterized protein LOC143448602 isoform X2 [Clavelina lepadiformis]|uniref:uncharacterized protein LOC143448602 isoform X2 n=1 Tax=Clavelina lepadiformis TaxID=159417 RepID=UPI00404356E3
MERITSSHLESRYEVPLFTDVMNQSITTSSVGLSPFMMNASLICAYQPLFIHNVTTSYFDFSKSNFFKASFKSDMTNSSAYNEDNISKPSHGGQIIQELQRQKVPSYHPICTEPLMFPDYSYSFACHSFTCSARKMNQLHAKSQHKTFCKSKLTQKQIHSKSRGDSLQNTSTRMKGTRPLATNRSIESVVPLVSKDEETQNKQPRFPHKNIQSSRQRCFKCRKCESYFSSRAGLCVHERTHTGEKPYQCKTCRKSFAQLGHVQRHQKVHTREKPYQCNICDARVRDKASMHYHILAHQGIKPFSCDQCDARFTKRSSLVKHRKVHTKAFRYKCHHCKASFREKAGLSRHTRCQHNAL